MGTCACVYMYLYTCVYACIPGGKDSLVAADDEMRLTCPVCYDTVSEQERAEVPHFCQKRPIYIKKRRVYVYLTCPVCYDTVSEQERAEVPHLCQKRPI